jgi:hypothetical protein
VECLTFLRPLFLQPEFLFPQLLILPTGGLFLLGHPRGHQSFVPSLMPRALENAGVFSGGQERQGARAAKSGLQRDAAPFQRRLGGGRGGHQNCL